MKKVRRLLALLMAVSIAVVSAGCSKEITAEDLARWSGTISYEILLSVGSRVERMFYEEK